jgi:hypothetical protein
MHHEKGVKMSGHFEKGAWKEGIGCTLDKRYIPLCVDFDTTFPCSIQVDRVANLLNLKSLSKDELNGEMIIKGASGKWYRILDFFEMFLKRIEKEH